MQTTDILNILFKLKRTNSSSIWNKFPAFYDAVEKMKMFAGSHHSGSSSIPFDCECAEETIHAEFSHLISYGESKPAGRRLADRGLASMCNENRATRECAGARVSVTSL